jgi:vWA-MoxR associated protein C-terminal domain
MTERGYEARWFLAELLLNVPTVANDDGRKFILEIFRAKRPELPELPSANLRIICYKLVDFAANQPGALRRLAEIVTDADRSEQAGNFDSEVRRLLPSDIFGLDERLEFIEQVRNVTRPEQLNMYYERAAGEMFQTELSDAGDLVDELEELALDEPCHPLILLTEEIARTVKGMSDRRAARGLSDRLARLIDASRPRSAGIPQKDDEEREKLALLRKSRKSQGKKCDAAPGTEHASLVVKLDPYVPRPEDGYRLSMWLYREKTTQEQRYVEDSPLSLDAIRGEVIRKLSELIRVLWKPATVTEIDLEFFLPRDLLNYPVEDWAGTEDYVTLGMQFVVVVRDGDRFNNPILWPPWQQKWTHVADSGSRPGGPLSRWITCMDEPCRSGELYPSLLDDELVSSLGLTFPPHPGARRFELVEALNAGTPIAVWPRGRCAHPVPASAADACQGVTFMEGLRQELAGRGLADLPGLVRKLRRERAAHGESSPGLALLWDNPDRLPVPGDSRLDAPQYWPQL